MKIFVFFITWSGSIDNIVFIIKISDWQNDGKTLKILATRPKMKPETLADRCSPAELFKGLILPPFPIASTDCQHKNNIFLHSSMVPDTRGLIDLLVFCQHVYNIFKKLQIVFVNVKVKTVSLIFRLSCCCLLIWQVVVTNTFWLNIFKYYIDMWLKFQLLLFSAILTYCYLNRNLEVNLMIKFCTYYSKSPMYFYFILNTKVKCRINNLQWIVYEIIKFQIVISFNMTCFFLEL